MTKNKQKTIVKLPKLLAFNAKLRKKPIYKSFRLHRRIKHHNSKLPSWWGLLKKSVHLMSANRKAIFVFFIVYGFLNLLLVRGFASQIDVGALRESFRNIVGDNSLSLLSGFTAFGLIVDSTAQGTGQVAQVYQTFLLVISSLSIIWLYRQQQAGNKVSMKMAFYRGMYPLVPFLLIILVIGLQFIPAMIGNFFYSAVLSSGLAIGGVEKVSWLLFFLSTLLLSLYMISSSAIALYVVTLPEMTPMMALRQARELVRYRRVDILLKTIAIVFVILASLFIVVLPVIFIAPALAEWIFFSVTVLGVPLVNGYMFSLYRELL